MQLDELNDLFKQAVLLRGHIQSLENQTETLQKQLNNLEQHVIPEVMVGLDMWSYKVGDQTFTLKKSYKARLTEQKAEEAIKFLSENGFGDLIRAQLSAEVGAQDSDAITSLLESFRAQGLEAQLKNLVHPNKLSAFVREQDEMGQLTDKMVDLLSVHEQYKVVIKETN